MRRNIPAIYICNLQRKKKKRREEREKERKKKERKREMRESMREGIPYLLEHIISASANI